MTTNGGTGPTEVRVPRVDQTRDKGTFGPPAPTRRSDMKSDMWTRR
jgi:hypothetical protein